MKACTDITLLTGKTPLLLLAKTSAPAGAQIYAKLEAFNPLSSIKDRIAVAMINAAEEQGLLQPGGTIIEPTSGNTGIGLAFAAAQRGYRLILTMPESMSLERRSLLACLGAELVLTPAAQGMKGAIEKALNLQGSLPSSWLPDQFANPANPAHHYGHTGPEIWEQTAGQVDIFVAGVGTGGTISGVGRYLKEQRPSLQVIAVEPADSPVLSGGQPAPHAIQGIGAGFVPDNFNRAVVDEILQVQSNDALTMAAQLAKEEGVFCGISSGAALSAALDVANRVENKGKNIVTVFPDTGERYLSTALAELASASGAETEQGVDA